VTAVEGDRLAAADVTANAAASRADVTTVHQPVEDFLRTVGRRRVEMIVVDPPRSGMSRESLDGVIGVRARQIVYVSCDVATLARDTRRFVDAGYTLERVDAFDLFPNTPHVETIAVLSDNQPRRRSVS
jgi:23S rRNA (uracil1939-C5)-methyltransferase